MQWDPELYVKAEPLALGAAEVTSVGGGGWGGVRREAAARQMIRAMDIGAGGVAQLVALA